MHKSICNANQIKSVIKSFLHNSIFMTDKLCIKVTKDILLMICFFICIPPSPI